MMNPLNFVYHLAKAVGYVMGGRVCRGRILVVDLVFFVQVLACRVKWEVNSSQMALTSA
jgi:hypothetical protein